ncbi:biopolymer transport protein ExbB [Shimia sp. SK013]|uniref:MotA/TolQ/ExbB proton channel family protein n=1 Tax=Shimia sp. SK013 TaxID=1389006 RepID=UPI0006B4356E|nr:MotA/TolQ/ExbB proton channel family protein [Shimia sp. SK013]KPA22440.1 biopolymer transport protein ExbB [Shimia sp. SK013]
MHLQERWAEALSFLQQGGPAIWAIAALSVITGVLILWKIWRLVLMGAWAGRTAEHAVLLWCQGDRNGAQSVLSGRRSLRAVVAAATMRVTAENRLCAAQQREEIERVARRKLGDARVGLRALELIATIAPLLGLLGTVLGMIAAFQTLQEAGSRADPADLAGGIWEALLTTAAGMAVAIPASVALTWFESVVQRAQEDMEDAATRIQTSAPNAQDVPLAAE